MNHKNISALTALSFAAAVALSACGGGGGGGGSSGSGAAAPATTPSGAGNLQTSVPAPTYAASTVQAAIFSQLNAYRSAMGVGLLKQDSVLDTSSSAHALYLVINLANGGITALSHNEISTNADYYEATPLSRARKAGAPATEWIAENASAGITQATGDANAGNCLGQFLNTVYHLQGATDAQETIGTGFVTNPAQGTYACVLDFGQTTNVAGSPGDNAFSPVGGQQMATTAIAVSPYDGESNVARSMVAESPNPAPDVAAPGRPVMIRVRADQAGDSLTVTSFTLTANGATVPARTIVPSAALSGSTGATADVNGALFNGVAVLLPLSPLAANTTYTVTFSGQHDGKPITKTTSFTTGA